MAKKPNKFQVMLLKDLATLGASAEAVARTLKKKGIKGTLEAVNSCPVAEFLKREYRGEEIAVALDIEVNGVTIRAPKAISDFIDKFDDEQYPELVKKVRK